VLAALRGRCAYATVYVVTVRCLLVDDSTEFLASATRLLESQGIQVVGSATRGAEALELATRLRPDLALIDVELADEDGFEVAETLEARVPTTRVVLISAYERDDLSELLPASNAVGFLPKSQLGVDAIARLLDG
jgi:DNA-binding NarL/FixJ family response regulator